MIYICEKCHYLFPRENKPDEMQEGKYRCPDCGKFGVREADEAERDEYKRQQEFLDEE